MKTRLTLRLCVIAVSVYAQSPGKFTATGDLTTVRFTNTATLLPSNEVTIGVQ